MTTHLHHVSSPPILVVGATGKTGRRVAERLIAADVPVRLAARGLAVYSHLFTETWDGRNAWITHGIQRGLGRSPKSFATYARRTAGTGVWQVAA
jgi:nucleoside-diphosphate-sugar epimerase